MNIEIWEEGYASSDGSGQAHLLGTYEAHNFNDAVRMYLVENPGKIKHYTHGALTGHHAIWGCRLFDNEADARKSFG